MFTFKIYSRNTLISHVFYLPKDTLETIFYTGYLIPKLFLIILITLQKDNTTYVPLQACSKREEFLKNY